MITFDKVPSQKHEKRPTLRCTISTLEVVKIENRTPIARSTTGNIPSKSILRPSPATEPKKRKKSRSVFFDEENVVVTSKRKKAREFCDKAFSELGEGNADGFLSNIEQAINVDPRFAYPWNLKGVMYAENMNKFEESLEFYQKALTLDPNYVDAWMNKAYALQSLNRLEESKHCMETAEAVKKKVDELKNLKKVKILNDDGDDEDD